MSALAVYLEREGIATVVVGLVKLHIEKVRPPRALWVPFELGRPLGGPGHPEFSKQVMTTALSLLDRDGPSPVIEEFLEDDPGGTSDEDWNPPSLDSAQSVEDEIELLRDRYEQSVDRFGTSQVGLSGVSLTDAAQFVRGFGTANPIPNPNDDMSDLLRMRFGVDDLRAYYTEAAAAVGNPTSKQIQTWFWKSHVAKEILRIRAENMDSDDAIRAIVCGKLLVPGAYAPSS